MKKWLNNISNTMERWIDYMHDHFLQLAGITVLFGIVGGIGKIAAFTPLATAGAAFVAAGALAMFGYYPVLKTIQNIADKKLSKIEKKEYKALMENNKLEQMNIEEFKDKVKSDLKPKRQHTVKTTTKTKVKEVEKTL